MLQDPARCRWLVEWLPTLGKVQKLNLVSLQRTFAKYVRNLIGEKCVTILRVKCTYQLNLVSVQIYIVKCWSDAIGPDN